VFVNFYDTVPVAFSQSLSLDNEAGASVDPPLLGYDDRQKNQSVILPCLMEVNLTVVVVPRMLSQCLMEVNLTVVVVTRMLSQLAWKMVL
jgi:hypothetical protein